MTPAFSCAVRACLLAVPAGQVVTYGQLAALAGYPRHARHVARVLAQADDLPWQRVVGADGRLARAGTEAADWQRVLLEAEGVTFDPRGRVRMAVHGWQPAPK